MGFNTQTIYDATTKLVGNICDYIKGLLSGENKGKMICIHEPKVVADANPIKWLHIDEEGNVCYITDEWENYKLGKELTANEATNLAEDLVSGHYNIVDYEK